MPAATPRFPIQPLQPGGYSVLDVSALQASAPIDGAPVVAVLGDSEGGKPNTALSFQTAGLLHSTLRSGPLYDTARAALIGGASTVICVRCGAPTQATKALAGATGTPVTLTSIGYGVWTDQIKVTVAANNSVTISYTDALGVTYNEVYAVGTSATAQNVADAINGKTPGFAKSQYVTAAVTTGTMPLTTAAIAAMTGGADTSSLVAGDWTTGLQALETQEVDLVVPATGDATVHAQVLTHCNAMSAVSARHERTTIVGAVAGESIAAQVTRIAALRDKRAQLVYPGITLVDDTGAATAFAPFVTAGYTAGKHAALPDVATSLVHSDLGAAVLDVEKALSTIPGGDLDTLLAAGVTPISAKPGGGFWYVDSLSGYIADFSFRDFHKIRTADLCAKRLREGLEAAFTGRKALLGLSSEIKTRANEILDDLVTEELLVGHNSADAVPDANSTSITYVTAPVVLPDTNKFVLLTVSLMPVSALANS